MAHVIERVLVANRGEIARRVFRTCAEMGVTSVAIYSDADRDAWHVAGADLAVAIGGERAQESYLDVAKVVAAALRAGADAVHPGYGFLSEQPEFAQACLDAGLVWIGPRPDTIRSMALKVEAKRLAANAGVPLLPGREVDGDDPDDWRRAAEEVGFPLLVKASAGGGGKGMRRVDDVADLAEAIRAGRREAASSFGDATVFLERLLEGPRHVEVQVIGDRYGSVVHLFDRDCSLQRRHQKVVEEAPAPGLSDAVHDRLQGAAVSLARSIGYENAGTVEFLVDGEECFFLEMNTRLQVEHPVTEAITGLDLVRLQLEIADGVPLPFTQDDLRVSGHAVEARLYAEDPRRDHLPSVGTLVCFVPPETPAIRWDSGVRSGSVVTPHYDPMLAKAIAVAPTRREAARRLALALRRLEVAGLRTNRDLLVAALESPEFLEASVSTDFLDAHPEVVGAQPPEQVVDQLVLGLALMLRERGRPADVPSVIPSGWRNVAAVDQRFELVVAGKPLEVGLTPPRRGTARAVVAGQTRVCSVLHLTDSTVDLVLDDVRVLVRVRSSGAVHAVSGAGWNVDVEELPRLPVAQHTSAVAGPTAPLPGVVVAVDVAPGDHVEADQLLVVVEAMKMEHRVVADRAGTVGEVLVAVGDRVDAHQPLVVLDHDG